MAEKFEHPALTKLSTTARAKVEAALKTTLERELVANAKRGGGMDPMAAHSRSQGAFFSRSKTTDAALGADDQVILEKVSTLSDEAFEKFAGRLAQLKGLKTR